MKVIFALAALAAVAVARPQEPALRAGTVPILGYELTRDEHGQYALTYITGDGTKVTEQGALVENDDHTGYVLVKQGSFSYTAPDGTPIQQTWTADNKGFHAEGDHLPTTPAPIAPAAAL